VDTTLADAGIRDPVGRAAARLEYARLPEKDRPALGDWLTTLRTDAKAREKVSTAIRSYFEGSTRTTNPDSKTKPPPPDTTADSIRNMPLDEFAKRTGLAP
jgi:hypothetical protein